MRKSRFFPFALVLGILFFFAAPDPGERGFAPIGAAHAQEDWKKEFEDICSKTQDAMVFSAEELKSLLGRCDKLKPLIERLEESQRKVYLRRLQMCRDLFFFMLETKEKK